MLRSVCVMTELQSLAMTEPGRTRAAVDPTLLAMLATLRCSLHAVAEPSGQEAMTSSIVSAFLANYSPTELIGGLGGYGIAAVFEGAQPGPTVMVRADLDGVPIEASTAESEVTSRHTCGHDAHMSMVAALAPLIAERGLPRGRVVLLFQPAEETAAGALAVLADPRFATIRPDFAIGLHNLPGFGLGSVVARPGPMASASVGLKCELRGIAAHAAQPERARTPRLALGNLLIALPELQGDGAGGRMVTVTHVRMGSPGFGVTPGQAELFATLRAHSSEALTVLRDEAEAAIRAAATAQELDCTFGWFDDYPATVNDATLVSQLQDVCNHAGIEFCPLAAPFSWSDDFGHFAGTVPSVYFGLGIGVDAAGLHEPGYAFPDNVLGTGIAVLSTLTHRMLQR